MLDAFFILNASFVGVGSFRTLCFVDDASDSCVYRMKFWFSRGCTHIALSMDRGLMMIERGSAITILREQYQKNSDISIKIVYFILIILLQISTLSTNNIANARCKILKRLI
jgi:hypothetical protein